MRHCVKGGGEVYDYRGSDFFVVKSVLNVLCQAQYLSRAGSPETKSCSLAYGIFGYGREILGLASINGYSHIPEFKYSCYSFPLDSQTNLLVLVEVADGNS